jgi:hypothetical protein
MNNWCICCLFTHIFPARHLYQSFGVKGLRRIIWLLSKTSKYFVTECNDEGPKLWVTLLAHVLVKALWSSQTCWDRPSDPSTHTGADVIIAEVKGQTSWTKHTCWDRLCDHPRHAGTGFVIIPSMQGQALWASQAYRDRLCEHPRHTGTGFVSIPGMQGQALWASQTCRYRPRDPNTRAGTDVTIVDVQGQTSRS